MKKILILIVAGLIFTGCAPDSLINNAPVNPEQREWLLLSDNQLNIETELTLSKIINGNFGGNLVINETVGNIQMTGALTIPAGAYPGNQNISVTLNNYCSYQEYRPSPYVFRIPLTLNLKYKNVSFLTDDIAKISFYYLADDGIFVKAECDSVIVDPANNTLGVIGARIPHFSRWGWAKSTSN